MRQVSAIYQGFGRQSFKRFKKTKNSVSPINKAYIGSVDHSEIEVEVISVEELCEAELDELWSFVGSKQNQRWLWVAIDHNTRVVLAYTFGKRKDVVFRKLKKLLEPFNITMFYTDDWGSYERNLNPENHTITKKNTQRIEHKNLNFRTRIKRLARKTIYYSRSVLMHDIIIGLVINILEFGLTSETIIHGFMA